MARWIVAFIALFIYAAAQQAAAQNATTPNIDPVVVGAQHPPRSHSSEESHRHGVKAKKSFSKSKKTRNLK